VYQIGNTVPGKVAYMAVRAPRVNIRCPSASHLMMSRALGSAFDFCKALLEESNSSALLFPIFSRIITGCVDTRLPIR
jgi:hypothetical protein